MERIVAVWSQAKSSDFPIVQLCGSDSASKRQIAAAACRRLGHNLCSGVDWESLVLPEAQRQILREIAAHVRQRAMVYETWGFGAKGTRGLGISTLFAGSSGTGKTLAAEVLAQELRLDLYRIDLSSVVSKYIGKQRRICGRCSMPQKQVE